MSSCVHRRYLVDKSEDESEEIFNDRYYMQDKSWSFIWYSVQCHTMQPCDNKRFILWFYKTCPSSVFICDCKWKFLFNHDENATIDADSMICTFVADHSDFDHMCDLGIRMTMLFLCFFTIKEWEKTTYSTL